MCGGSDVPPPPQPSAEEKALQRETLSLLQQSRKEMDALRPILLSESGLEQKNVVTADQRKAAQSRGKELNQQKTLAQEHLNNWTSGRWLDHGGEADRKRAEIAGFSSELDSISAYLNQ